MKKKKIKRKNKKNKIIAEEYFTDGIYIPKNYSKKNEENYNKLKDSDYFEKAKNKRLVHNDIVKDIISDDNIIFDNYSLNDTYVVCDGTKYTIEGLRAFKNLDMDWFKKNSEDFSNQSVSEDNKKNISYLTKI